MDCFLTQRGNSDDDYDYSGANVKTWSPKTMREKKPAQQVKNLYCQAYVQILFAEKGKWVPDSIGELMAYKMNSANDDEEEMYLSFFSGPRQRFQIKVSDIKKMYKPHPNLIVVVHGKTIMGFNFALEHKHRVDVFMKQIRPNLPVAIIAAKIRRAAENISGEMKKTANKLKTSLNIEPSNDSQETNKVALRELKDPNIKEISPDKLIKRRSSDPSVYMEPQRMNDYCYPVKSGQDTNLSTKSILRSPPILKSSKEKQYNTLQARKKVTFDSTVQRNKLPRSQSLRRRHEVNENNNMEYLGRRTHVRELITLWDSKR